MKTKRLGLLVLVVVAALVLLAPALPVYAAPPVVITPGAPNGWFFYDDGYPGGIGNMVTGPGTAPLGTGSVHFALNATARETIATTAYAGTRMDKITNLQYSTYRSSVDPGNNLAVTLQFEAVSDVNVPNPPYQGRLVFEPYLTPGGGGTIVQNTWQTWNPLSGRWYGTRDPFKTPCPMSTPCTWAQVLSNWPNAGLSKTGALYLKAGGPWAGFDGAADALTVGVNGTDTTYDFEPGGVGLVFVPTSALLGLTHSVTISINVNSVSNLYGYQFQVNYDSAKVSASGAFVNTFFDTSTNATIPPAWNAVCASGVCQFAASKTAPGTASTGSGTLATITFTGNAVGVANQSFSSDLLADVNGNPIPDTPGTGTVTVYGYAAVAGTVALQGRATPIDSGTVTLTDLGGNFPTVSGNFSAVTGAFSFANVPAMPGGSNYQFDAAHVLYLGNRQTHTLNNGDSYTAPLTTLKGGDADNSGLIDISDLSCIGGAFGGPPTVCGTAGSSDINKDNIVNILDLVLAGGNYNLSTPQPW